MTDAINPFSRQAPSNPAVRKLSEKAPTPEASAAAGAAASQVDDASTAKPSASSAKSSDAGAFSAISVRLKQEPEFDRAKVDSIKKAIENGQYPLNSRRIAESFIALEQLIGP